PRPDPQVHVRFRQPKLDEEDIGHSLVVVLARVNYPLLVAESGERVDDRRRLDEIWPGPKYMRDRHAQYAFPSSANICPRDCTADAASGRARRICDAAACDR